MNRTVRPTLVLLVVVASFLSPSSAQKWPRSGVHYTVSLAHAPEHRVGIQMEFFVGPAPEDIQLPVWNALYQVRDFAQYVDWIRAESVTGKPLSIRERDKTSWRIEGVEDGARVSYEVFADQGGPYGAQANSQHAFFNLAEILMYPLAGRNLPVEIDFTGLPTGWRIATALSPIGSTSSATGFRANDYDQLIDSPVEMGTFAEASFEQAGAHYRLVVDADPADYDLNKLVAMVKSVVASATSWMNDQPFDQYLFIYHFPRGPGGGGMEHAYSTSIELNSRLLREAPQYLNSVTAHEFFHLWNVKRIRPQSLEPIDYAKENYTRALWFSEGVTSTVAPYILLRAGLLDEAHYLEELGVEITSLERRPARLTQSVEESSLQAWLEKYNYYRAAERSISYYNKGELVGVMLDLEVREASHGTASLRDVFLWMNEHYAKQDRFFPDSEGVLEAAEAVSHADLKWFFQKYVAGREEIPYNRVLKTVGLEVKQRTITVADPGFTVGHSFGGPSAVAAITPANEAERAGLAVGDLILKINGQPLAGELESQLALLHPGDLIHITISHHQQERELAWRLGGRREVEFDVKDVDNVTPQQRARRAAWLAGEDQKPGERRP